MKHSIAGACLMLPFVVLSQTASAQLLDTVKARYNNETLHFYGGFIAKGQNNERIRLRQLKNEFTISRKA